MVLKDFSVLFFPLHTYTEEAWPFLSSKDFFPLTTTDYSLDLSYRTYIEYKTCVS